MADIPKNTTGTRSSVPGAGTGKILPEQSVIRRLSRYLREYGLYWLSTGTITCIN